MIVVAIIGLIFFLILGNSNSFSVIENRLLIQVENIQKRACKSYKILQKKNLKDINIPNISACKSILEKETNQQHSINSIFSLFQKNFLVFTEPYKTKPSKLELLEEKCSDTCPDAPGGWGYSDPHYFDHNVVVLKYVNALEQIIEIVQTNKEVLNKPAIIKLNKLDDFSEIFDNLELAISVLDEISLENEILSFTEEVQKIIDDVTNNNIKKSREITLIILDYFLNQAEENKLIKKNFAKLGEKFAKLKKSFEKTDNTDENSLVSNICEINDENEESKNIDSTDKKQLKIAEFGICINLLQQKGWKSELIFNSDNVYLHFDFYNSKKYTDKDSKIKEIIFQILIYVNNPQIIWVKYKVNVSGNYSTKFLNLSESMPMKMGDKFFEKIEEATKNIAKNINNGKWTLVKPKYDNKFIIKKDSE